MPATSKQLNATAKGAPDPSVLAVGLGAFAALQLVTGIFMAVAPHAFFKYVGPFGTINVHYLRDLATFYIADGLALALAVRLVSWRVPALFLTSVQFVLHSLNHLLDINKAHPAWNGYFDFFSLSAATLMLLWLWRRAVIEAGGTGSARSFGRKVRADP
jgi:hypothetical protein